MKRSAPLVRKAPISRGTSQLKRTAMKKRAPKKRPGHDKRMLDACRGQHCYLRIPGVCRDDTATTVPAHRNEGKGVGLKVPDKYTLPACYWCHYEYDQGNRFTREEKRGLFNAAYPRWAAYREQRLGLAA
ncbi:HNH endonuclease [Ralstonia phage Cimandef]|uniref:DUF1364 domain-containing protein n=1 Tax=Ralstonia phage Cimandef TaxID=2759720 RepID=A0A7G5B8N1_9CAUD|nr:HNH endonuclease [Ralstonia phage Cimandef]QMV32654.1 hypothetical protein B2_00020 [Ralstonia phage Cimandef]